MSANWFFQVAEMVVQVLGSLQSKRPPGWVGTQMAHRAAQGLGTGQSLTGLDQSSVSPGLCWRTSHWSDCSGVWEPRWQSTSCNWLAGGRGLMWLQCGGKFCNSATARSSADRQWPVVVGVGPAWTLSPWFHWW